MTTVTEIINDAFRQSNLVAAGGSPTAPQSTEALRYLNRIVKSVFGTEVGEALSAIPIGGGNISRPSGYPWYGDTPDGDWVVPKNVRVVLNLENSLDLYLHPEPNDGTRFALADAASNLGTNALTVYGNGRTIEGSTSVTFNTDGETGEWFYRQDTANWAKYAPLAELDTFPFPEEFDDYFITMLALRINPSYGTMLDNQSAEVMRRSKTQLRARYNQNVPVRSDLALLRLSRMARDRDEWGSMYSMYDSGSMFEKGWPL